MGTTTIQHNKLRNTGILFEILVRQLTSDILEGTVNSVALDIIRERFSSQTQLGKELQLYQVFSSESPMNESRAEYFINTVIHQRCKLDESKLNKEKYELVKELKEHYDVSRMLSTKLPSYKRHASVYKIFLAEVAKKNEPILNIEEVISARFFLIESLSGKLRSATKESAVLEEFQSQTEDLRLLSYKILIDKFNDKYEHLNSKQKNLLREYINNVANPHGLREYVSKEISGMKSKIQNAVLEKPIGEVSKIKLNEVCQQLDKISESKKKSLQDEELTALMIAYQLVKEME